MTVSTTTTSRTNPSPVSRFFARHSGEISLFVVLILLALAFSIATPYFLTRSNLINLGQTVGAVGIVSIIMTLVIVSGGIDLSVGSTAALAGVVISALWAFANMPLGIAAVVGMIGALLVGVVNGFMVTRIKVNPLIATLATFSIVRGLAFVISSGQSNQVNDRSFQFLGRGAISGIPFSLILLIVIFLIASWVMAHTRFGRDILAIGGNPEAARLAGIRARRRLMTVYILSGLAAGFAGILVASQLAVTTPRSTTGLELTAISAVVLGGTSLSGGKGTLVGTLIGVLILRILDNGLVLMNVSSFYQEVASGVVLVLAVTLDQLRIRLGSRS